MTFTVTYRGADGALREERVEAANRAECFAKMKAQGIAPMSVKEGWHGLGKAPSSGKGNRPPSGTRGSGAKAPSFAGRALLALAALALIGGGAWWWFGRGEAQPSPEPEASKKPSALAKEVKPAAAPKPVEKEPEAPKVAAVDPRYEVPEGAYRDARGVLRRPGGMRILEKPPERTINLFDESQPRVFSNMVDNAIAGMLKSLEKGSPVMLQASGYGPHFMRNLERALKDPIEINESDSEETRRLKLDVQAVHDELKERMEHGEDAAELLREARRQVYEVNMYRHRLRGEIAKYSQKEGVTEQDCKEFAAVVNELLKERGAKPLALPGLVVRAMRNAEGANDGDGAPVDSGTNGTGNGQTPKGKGDTE